MEWGRQTIKPQMLKEECTQMGRKFQESRKHKTRSRLGRALRIVGRSCKAGGGGGGRAVCPDLGNCEHPRAQPRWQVSAGGRMPGRQSVQPGGGLPERAFQGLLKMRDFNFKAMGSCCCGGFRGWGGSRVQWSFSGLPPNPVSFPSCL